MKSFRYNARIQNRNLDISGSIQAESSEDALKKIVDYNFIFPVKGEFCRLKVWTERESLTEKEVAF